MRIGSNRAYSRGFALLQQRATSAPRASTPNRVTKPSPTPRTTKAADTGDSGETGKPQNSWWENFMNGVRSILGLGRGKPSGNDNANRQLDQLEKQETLGNGKSTGCHDLDDW